MGRTKEAVFMGIGILAGLALSGPASAAVDYLQARPSTQAVYVDGQKADMEAYSIHDNNFVMLRDIGEAVGFNVYWDGATRSVQVERDKPYTGVGPGSTQPPAAVTEESVQAALAALRERYPNNSPWPAPYRSTSGGPYSRGINCSGWATLCSDAAFGNLPWRRIDHPCWEDIRPGDLVEYDNDQTGHVVVAVSKSNDWLTFTDSGPELKAYWGGQYPRWWLEQQPGLTLYTRYPQ